MVAESDSRNRDEKSTTFLYDLTIDPTAENNTHAFALAMIGHNKRVLEVGCATGYFTKVLAERGCKVVGMEIDPQAAHAAETWAEHVVVGDIEQTQTWEQVDDESFDVVTFGDVLEHLRDPLAVLRRAVVKLKPSGFVVASLPNFAHGDVRLSLLHGNFEYRDLGLLDRSHLRFFTRESVRGLFQEAGLLIVDTQRVVMPMFCTELGVNRQDFPDSVLDEIRTDIEYETYQFVIKCVIDNGSTAVAELADRISALNDSLQELRVGNRALQDQLGGLAELRADREHLEGRVAELIQREDEFRSQLTAQTERAAQLQETIDALQAALADCQKRYNDILHSTSWRFTAPLRRFRRK
jgi:2-polyprenyl-3-methyl-5-hydroxy-6-metoxy-1,4-benzoquinol methylase